MLIAGLIGGGLVVRPLDELGSRCETFTLADSFPLAFSCVLAFFIHTHGLHTLETLADVLERRHHEKEYPNSRHRSLFVRADPGRHLRIIGQRNHTDPMAVSTLRSSLP